jgi:hypothetical protein
VTMKMVNARLVSGIVASAVFFAMPRHSLAEPAPASSTSAAPGSAETVVAASPPTPPSSMSRRTVAFVAAGLAVAGAGAAAIFGGLALQNKSDFQKGATYARSDDGNNDAAYSDGGIALAVAAGVTSLVLFLTSESTNDDPVKPAPKKGIAFLPSPMVVPHGGGAGALFRF